MNRNNDSSSSTDEQFNSIRIDFSFLLSIRINLLEILFCKINEKFDCVSMNIDWDQDEFELGTKISIKMINRVMKKIVELFV